jgi:hypothetical protein
MRLFQFSSRIFQNLVGKSIIWKKMEWGGGNLAGKAGKRK